MVTYEVKQEIGVLSETEAGYSKKLTLTSWNGGRAKYDLRTWHGEKPLKGIGLSGDELTKLKAILDGMSISEGE